MTKRKYLLLFMMLFPLLIMAQNEASKKLIKYEEFVSKSGRITKFVDKKLPNCQIDFICSLKSRIRTVFGENKNLYFLVLEKGKTVSNETTYAYIEYSDLIETNKAYARLLSEVNADCETKPDYLQNVFTSEDGFKIGYYVEKSKASWGLKLVYGGPFIPVSRPEDFAKNLLDAQKEIEAIMVQNGK